MSLADHWDHNEYLTEGWHIVQVKGHESFQYNSGSDGIKFTLATDTGKTGEVAFITRLSKPGSDEDAMDWKLAQFAKACGITREQGAKYDPRNESCHRVLVGKRVQVLVVKDGKYHKVDSDEFMSADEPQPMNAPAFVAETAPPTAPDDDIPF